MKIDGKLYFDLVSPFSYFYIKRLGSLDPRVKVELVPVLFGGLLKAFDNIGPAEVAPKRLHTYKYCTWYAARNDIPFRMPPYHPFNPLKALRLLTAIGPTLENVSQAFAFIFEEGRDVNAEWSAFCLALKVEPERGLEALDETKRALTEATQNAAQAGIFGVPTLVVDNHVFWGVDTIEWANGYLQDSSILNAPGMADLEKIPVGIARKLPGKSAS